MEVRFLYVRHGETLFNRTGRLQGNCDSPLTEEGIAATVDTASSLACVSVSRCYVSPLERTVDTAEILCRGRNVRIIEHAGLLEFDFGDLDGNKLSEIQDVIKEQGMDFSAVNGESCAHFNARMHAFFDDVLQEAQDGETVMLVGHGAWYRHMEMELFGQRGARLSNACFFFFRYKDGAWIREDGPYTASQYREAQQKTVTFYYVRHGLTLFNQHHRMQGWAGGPLSQEGIQQAYAAKDALQDVCFDAAYTSTAFRARETMKILLKERGITPKADKRLREVFFGNLEGEYYPAVMEEVERRHITEDWEDIGGENRQQIHARLRSFFQEAADRAMDGDTILCTAHGILYMNVLEVLFGISRQDAYQDARERNANPMPGCGIFRFRYENGKFIFEQFMRRPEEWRDNG